MKTNRKILLINPGYYEVGDYGYYHQPPMGILKIGSYFKKKGAQVELLDCAIPSRLVDTGTNLKDYAKNAPFVKMVKCGNYENEGISKAQRYFGMPHLAIRERIKAAKPTEIWLGTGLTYYWEAVRDVAIMCKDIYPDVPLLLGGIYPTLYPQHAQDHIPHDYLHQGPLDDIDDEFPDYTLYDDEYDSTRTLQLGKGCNVVPPCSFCAVVAMDPKFKTLSPDATYSYIKKEYELHGVNFFRIWSSQLLVPRSRFQNLMKLIIDSKIKVGLVASEGVQPSLYDQETSDLMKKAGFMSVSIPMESIDDGKVEEFRKPSDFNDYSQAVVHAQKSDFKLIKTFVMLGIPGQTIDEIIRGIVDCWARDTQPALHQYTPIPGSYDWERFPQFHGVSPELLHPSLWPGANPDMTVESLEEVKKVARIGHYRLSKAYRNKSLIKVKYVWDRYIYWAKDYGLLNSDLNPTYDRSLVQSGYTSAWTDKCLNLGIIPKDAFCSTTTN